MLLYFGRKIQKKYDSWEEYATSYTFGRMFWASGFEKSQKYYIETNKILNILLSDDGLWKILKWDVELEWWVWLKWRGVTKKVGLI